MSQLSIKLTSVKSVFGMNFFLYNEDTRRIQISNDFWIFIATWLPLTLITGTLYILVVYLDKRAKGKPFNWPWSQKKRAILASHNTESTLAGPTDMNGKHFSSD
jgi:hypothetical protein